MSPQRILCPIDFSDCSQKALGDAGRLAAEHGAKLFVVHVDEGGQTRPPGTSGYQPELDEHRRLLQLGPPAEPDVDYELHYLRGNASDEIRRFAILREIDLIVMGTHGRSGIAKVLLGSIAESVSQNAPCSVLTVCPSEGTHA